MRPLPRFSILLLTATMIAGSFLGECTSRSIAQTPPRTVPVIGKLVAPAEIEVTVGGLAKTLTIDNPGRKPIAILNPFGEVIGFWEIVSRDPAKQLFLVQGISPGRYTLFVMANGVTPDLPPEEAARIVVTVKPQSGKPADPVTPPIDQPAKPASLYFLIVRPDGPADPAFTKAISDPAWATLRKTYSVKDMTVTQARDLNVVIPAGTAMPCVVTMRIKPDEKWSDIVRSAIPMPTTADAILKLPEGVQ